MIIESEINLLWNYFSFSWAYIIDISIITEQFLFSMKQSACSCIQIVIKTGFFDEILLLKKTENCRGIYTCRKPESFKNSLIVLKFISTFYCIIFMNHIWLRNALIHFAAYRKYEGESKSNTCSLITTVLILEAHQNVHMSQESKSSPHLHLFFLNDGVMISQKLIHVLLWLQQI